MATKKFNLTYSVIFLRPTKLDNNISAYNYSTYESAVIAAKQEMANGNEIISIRENYSTMELDDNDNEIKVNHSYQMVGFYQDIKGGGN